MRYDSPGLIRYGQIIYKLRDGLFPGTLLVLTVIFRPQLAGGSVRIDTVLDAIGILVVLTGIVYRAAVIGYEYIRRGGKNREVYADHLVTGGLFAHSRNPLYVGNLLLVIGLLLIFNNLWAYLIGLTFAATSYRAIVANEESYLRGRFGEEYEAYCRRTPRWIPRFNGIRATLAEYEFNWSRVIVKDYGTAIGALVGILLYMVYERIAIPEYGMGALQATVFGFGFGTLIAAYIAIHLLKKRRVLTQNGWGKGESSA